MTAVAEKLYQILLNGRHLGRENAVPDSFLARLLDISPKAVGRYALEAMAETGTCICATCLPPAGRFIAATEEEKDEYARSLKGRAIEIFKRRKVVRRAKVLIEKANCQKEFAWI